MNYVRLTDVGESSVESNQRLHVRRHVIMFVALFMFLLFGVWIVADWGSFCNQETSNMNVNGTWQIEYISERIAQCKDDQWGGTASAILPWITVVTFPFIMIQYHITYLTIIRNMDNADSTHFDPRTRATVLTVDATDPSLKTPSSMSLAGMSLQEIIIRLLESISCGSYFWLVFYNHTGAHRQWHGISTGTLFICATILNIILCYVYGKYERHKDEANRRYWKIITVNVIVILQFCSVIAFLLAFYFQSGMDMDEQDIAIVLEYVVALIWFMTVIMNCILYWFIRDVEHSPPLAEWTNIVLMLYVSAIVGVGLVRGLLQLWPAV